MRSPLPSIAIAVASWLAATHPAHAQNGSTTPFPSGLTPAALDANARFGAAVDLDGNRAIVGAPDEDGGKGAVYIHEFDGSSWSAGLRLQPSDGVALDHFGSAVAIAGDWALVGVPDDDDFGADAGSVHVYKRTLFLGSYLWLLSAKLSSIDIAAGDRFGAAVAMVNGRAVIGAPNDSIVFFHQGSAYAFELSGNTWSQLSKLTVAGSQVNENFGSAVAIDGDHIVVGGPGWDNVAPSVIDSGRAGIFIRLTNPSTGWFLDQEMKPTDLATSQRYGSSVALEGTWLMIGVPGALNLSAAATGATYVYESIGMFGAWQQRARILPPGVAVVGDLFGSGVAIAGTHAYIASKDRVLPYDRSGTVFTSKPQLAVPFPEYQSGAFAKLGNVLAVNATHLFVGRPSAGAGDKGTAFPYLVSGGSWTNLGTGTLGSGGIPRLRGEGPLEDNTPLELRLKFGKPNAPAILLVHLGVTGNQPFAGGTLFAYPIDLQISLTTNATGEIVLPSNLPPGLVSVTLNLQYLIGDSLANGGVALSNGIAALTAP